MSPHQESSKVLQEVAFRNNEAVLLMELGDCVSAATILQHTIDVMQSYHDCMKGYSEEDGFFMDLDVPADSVCSLSQSLPTTQAAREHAPIGLFDRAFFLDHRELSAQGSTFSVRQFCLIVLFYNMGLCMHVQAHIAPSGQDEFFGQAITLYQMACGLHETSSDERLILLLQLALTNNLASVHAHYYDTHETKRWLDEVRFTYVLNAKQLDRNEWALFSTNLLVNEQILARSAPAA